MDVINAELNYTSIGKTVDVDLDNYYTKEETDRQIDNAIDGIDVDLTGYATERYVNDAISAIEIPEETDLSNFYNKQEVDALIPDITGFALKTEIPDVSGFALKSEIPSTSGLATEKYVDDAIANIDIPETDLSNYYNKTEVEALFNSIVDGNEVAY